MAVVFYPAPAGAAPSDRFEVLADEATAFVERWGDVSYVRFATAGPVPIAIRAAGPVAGARILPRSAISAPRVDGDTIRFDLLRPANLAVLVPGMARLFVLADPPDETPADGLNVVDLGADPTGRRVATTAIQRALDAAAGRTVLVPAGTFVTGTLVLGSGARLHLAAGATLRGSADPADYPIDAGRRETGSDASIASADERYRGETMTFSRLLLFDGAEDAELSGRGTLDGSGRQLRQVHGAVPNVIRVRGGRRIVIRDLLIRDAAAWTVHLLGARDVRVDNVKIVNDRSNLNTDGIDPDACQDVTIRRCLIHTKDDGVCVKATNNGDVLADVARILVEGNVVSSLDAALKVGTESQAARFDDIVFRDNDVFDCGRAMSVVVRDGATYSDVTFEAIRVAPGVAHLVEQVIGLRRGRVPTLGRIERLTFADIHSEGFVRPASNRTWYAQFRPGDGGAGDVPVFAGADETHALRGLVLRNVVVNGVRLGDRERAAAVAGLTIGPHVDGVKVE